MKIFKILIISLLLTSCTDAKFEKYTNFGNKFKVELFTCGETPVKTWISTGKVLTEEVSDGYYFKDSVTVNIVEVSGNVLITNQK